jgi:hypothetical protein
MAGKFNLKNLRNIENLENVKEGKSKAGFPGVQRLD